MKQICFLLLKLSQQKQTNMSNDAFFPFFTLYFLFSWTNIGISYTSWQKLQCKQADMTVWILFNSATHTRTHTRLVNTDLLVPPRSMCRPSGWTPVSINRNWGKVSQLRHRARHQADKVQWRAPTPIPTHTHTYTAIKYALSLAAQINNRPTSWWDFKWALICWELSLVTIDERRKNDRTRDGLNKHQETIRDKDGETERERQRIEKNRTELWDA